MLRMVHLFSRHLYDQLNVLIHTCFWITYRYLNNHCLIPTEICTNILLPRRHVVAWLPHCRFQCRFFFWWCLADEPPWLRSMTNTASSEFILPSSGNTTIRPPGHLSPYGKLNVSGVHMMSFREHVLDDDSFSSASM
jgi:hypothetical protein